MRQLDLFSALQSSTEGIDTEIKSVEIYNLQGQKIKTALSKQVNVSDLSAGIYMVRMEDTNNAVETKKIVKQ